MDPAMLAAMAGGAPGGAPPGAPAMGGGMPPGMPGMPMAPPPPVPGGTPAEAALPMIMMMIQQQQAQAAELHDQQASSLMSAMAEAVGQLPNPLGAAAVTAGAMPPPPDQLGSVDSAMQEAVA